MRKVLIFEHSKSMRNVLRERLEYEGFSVETTEDRAVALRLCGKNSFDVMVAEAELEPHPGIPYIILASKGTIDSAVKALKSGASDYLTCPVDMNRLLEAIDDAFKKESDGTAEAGKAVPAPKTVVRRVLPTVCPEIVGQSPIICDLRHQIDKVAPCEARVLITGESGTGKELVVHRLHARSNRRNAPLVEINCAAIPTELIESELFGHEKGAFTSAIRQRKGKFEQADGGTLFLDEIGDMSLLAQAKVLRTLQERKICRVGGDKDIAVDVRVVAATNKDLKKEIAKGNFREDLYHRIAVIELHVPPLREHSDDIPLLADWFIHQLSAEYGTLPKEIDPDAMEALKKMEWTGNVRELRNNIERLMVLSEKRITLYDVKKYC